MCYLVNNPVTVPTAVHSNKNNVAVVVIILIIGKSSVKCRVIYCFVFLKLSNEPETPETELNQQFLFLDPT